jgi:hypothetical protein
VEQQWNALGALADRVLRQAAEAREASVGQLREAEAAQGRAAHEGSTGGYARAGGTLSQQLELPLL